MQKQQQAEVAKWVTKDREKVGDTKQAKILTRVSVRQDIALDLITFRYSVSPVHALPHAWPSLPAASHARRVIRFWRRQLAAMEFVCSSCGGRIAPHQEFDGCPYHCSGFYHRNCLRRHLGNDHRDRPFPPHFAALTARGPSQDSCGTGTGALPHADARPHRQKGPPERRRRGQRQVPRRPGQP